MDTYNMSNAVRYEPKKSVFDEIIDFYKGSDNKIELWIWGTGSVAAGITKKLVNYPQIQVSGYFVDVNGDYYVDDRLNYKKSCIATLDELIEKGNRINVIVGHSKYQIISEIENINIINKIWILPALARQDDGIDYKYYIDHLPQFEKSSLLLTDNLSIENLHCYLNAKINKDELYLRDVEISDYFDNDIFSLTDKELFIDLGAFRGDTTDLFIKKANNYQGIICFEILNNQYIELTNKYKDNSKITVSNLGLSDHNGIDYFIFDSQSSHIVEKKIENANAVEVVTLDSYLEETHINASLIKICIGKSIMPILRGMSTILKKAKTRFIIHMGIDKSSLITVLDYINNISEEKYLFYLRFSAAMSECLILYAVPK